MKLVGITAAVIIAALTFNSVPATTPRPKPAPTAPMVVVPAPFRYAFNTSHRKPGSVIANGL